MAGEAMLIVSEPSQVKILFAKTCYSVYSLFSATDLCFYFGSVKASGRLLAESWKMALVRGSNGERLVVAWAPKALGRQYRVLVHSTGRE